MNLPEYLFAAMVAWSPISAHNYAESPAITQARYMDIADQIASAAMEEKPLFAGANGVEKTALLLASIASFESGGFRGDVQFCLKAGDSNHAWGLFQSHAGKGKVCGSIRDAAHVALEQARESFAACHDLVLEEKLSGYTSGNCVDGRKASATRMRRAIKYWTVHSKELQ